MWTGGNGYGDTSQRSYAGAAQVRMGDLGDATRPLGSPATKAASEGWPLYALSPVFTVAVPQEAPPEVQDSPGQQQAAAVVTGLELRSSGPYGAGDAISVGAAFSREVTVAGAPELSIEVGGERRTATYDAAQSGPSGLVFSYTVQAGDRDGDGVSVYPGSIVLPAGASIRDAEGNDAELAVAGLPPQPGHTVDGSVGRNSPPNSSRRPTTSRSSPPIATAAAWTRTPPPAPAWARPSSPPTPTATR